MTKFIGVMDKDVNAMIFDDQEFDRAANYYSDKLINDHAWRKKMYKKHHHDLKEYYVACAKFRKLPFAKMTDKHIVREVKRITMMQEKVRVFGVMLNGLVLDGRGHLTNKLQNELESFIGDSKELKKYWPILTQVTKLSFRQKKDLAVAKLAAKKISYGEALKQLKNIHKKYEWLDYMYYGPAINFESFEQEYKAAKKKNNHLTLEQDLIDIAQKQWKIMQQLKFNSRAKHLVKIAQTVLWQKAWRKDVEYHGFYSYEPMLKEMAKRKKEADWRNILYLFPWEFENFVFRNKPSLGEIKKRRAFSVLVVSGLKNIKMMTGKSAKNYYKTLNLSRSNSKTTEISGQTAYQGFARGTVRLIFVPKDMEKMRQGDILVSQATSPDLISAMKKASAIVTNTGGLICHAAITARELKIPCVVGTNNATDIFKDGDRVEVDAHKGIIRKI